MSNYRQDAKDDAENTALNFQGEIVEMLIEKEEASDDLYNDYPNGDAWHHENHVDVAYSLQEAAELLGELYYCEEEDSGLWEGQPPRQAISTQAAFTYGNAVMEAWQTLITEINSQFEDWQDDWDETEDHRVEGFSDEERGGELADRDERKADDLSTALTDWIQAA